MKLKICGIRNQEMFNFCKSNKIDFIGFNFVPFSKRKLINFELLNEKITSKKVALFMNQAINEVSEILEKFNFEIVQFHGKESPEYIKKIQKKFPQLKIWKAFSIDQTFEKKQLKNYEKIVDCFLFDGKNPGSGQSISDFSKLQEILNFSEKLKIPYGIAGGINTENMLTFKQNFPKALFLDTASGVEKNKKFDIKITHELIKNFKK